jgi:hypothetical protein
MHKEAQRYDASGNEILSFKSVLISRDRSTDEEETT